ncbi:AraC family transcriptional regulator [Paenibacillus sp. NPDC093718]|uniref:helix-turn-helix transcriptional regulator n=1 Tax=Paenibacillus sp. NPDC093718 TaxID=3390601 RepID=UPI003D03F48D
MNYRESLDLGPAGYVFNYRDETKEKHWKKVHAHQGIEVLYIHQGLGEISLEGSHFPLQNGTLVIFQPYQLHRVEVPVHHTISYIRTNLTFNPHLVEPWLAPFPRIGFFFRKLWRGVLKQQVFQMNEDPWLPNLLEDFRQPLSHPAAREEDLGLFLLTLLRQLERHVFTNETAAGPFGLGRATQHVENIMEWVEEHFREPFELQRIAEDLHLSPYHLSHLFKQYTGQTISDYIAARRIREACALLMLTEKPVKVISREVGGLSDPYFCQLFKKKKGITPQAYRDTVRPFI